MSDYVGTNALAALNIVYPIVNILTGIALIFATGSNSITALYIGGNEKESANRSFTVSFATAVTTIIFNRTALSFAGENGIAAVSIIMYLQFLFTGIYFGFSMGIATPLGYAYGNKRADVCRILERYAYRFFIVAPIVIYILTYRLTPLGVSFFSDSTSPVFSLAVSGMRIYGVGFLFSGINIFSAIRLMSYGKAIYHD